MLTVGLVFIVQTLSFMNCSCNFICGLSDVIIKTFSQSVSQDLITSGETAIKLPTSVGDLDPISWAHMSLPPDRITIGSSVLHSLTRRRTDHATCNMCRERPHLCTACGRRDPIVFICARLLPGRIRFQASIKQRNSHQHAKMHILLECLLNVLKLIKLKK